jgi:hypothetical protein
MKKLVSILFASVLLMAGAASAQNQFPDLSGKTLKGKNVKLPKDTQGKYTLLGVAYSMKSDKLLKEWFEPVYTTFIDQSHGSDGFIPTSSYNVNVYFIPMVAGIKQAASGKIEDEMQKKVDAKLHEHVLLYKGSIKEYKEVLKLGEKDLPYFFVLDENGKIVYATQGAYSVQKMGEVEQMLE